MGTKINNLLRALRATITFLFSVNPLQRFLKNENSWISKEGMDILKNPNDQKTIQEAIHELKNSNETTKTVRLSSGVVTIRID